jgi:hypothetical protein
MSVKSKPYYWLVCDDCSTAADYGDFSAYGDAGQAIDSALDSDWTTDGERHHCPACASLTVCETCRKPAGDLAGERDDLCQECWGKAEAEDLLAAEKAAEVTP